MTMTKFSHRAAIALNILINSDLESSMPLLKNSIEALGFKFEDTKILLISHAHPDHDAGSAGSFSKPARSTW